MQHVRTFDGIGGSRDEEGMMHCLSFVHQLVHRLCTAKPPHNRAAEMYELCVRAIRAAATSAAASVASDCDASMVWAWLKQMHQQIAAVFGYLDKHYTARERRRPIRDVMLETQEQLAKQESFQAAMCDGARLPGVRADTVDCQVLEVRLVSADDEMFAVPLAVVKEATSVMDMVRPPLDAAANCCSVLRSVC